MTITPILEKLVLNGWAQFRLFNLAFGSFEKILVPENSFAVVTQVIWNHFVNPIKNFDQTITWGEFFKYNEYQLKIQTDDKIDHYEFRNTIKWTNNNAANPIALDANINQALFEKWFIQEPNPNPVIIDTYLTASKFIDLSITRNAYVKTFTSTYNQLNAIGNQQPAPNALGNSNVVLNTVMTSPKGSVMNYVPPGFVNSSIAAATSRQVDIYRTDISTADANSFESNLQSFDNSIAPSSAKQPFTNFPLITLGVVMVNKNYFDQIKG